MQKDEGRELQENNIVGDFPQCSEKQENTEDEIRIEPNPQAALLWMLGMGRKMDPERMEWK
ncbi:MAG: hypothetical protein IKF90_09490 [Parasporobacterium sp.]|nr:hypothetical protein [Parasporobacterium sp.]